MKTDQPVWTLALIDGFNVIKLQRPSSSADCAMRPRSERVIAIRETGGEVWTSRLYRDEPRRSFTFANLGPTVTKFVDSF